VYSSGANRKNIRSLRAYYFFIVIVIRHETTAAAGWALLLIVRTFLNDAITVAVRTGFHVWLPEANPPTQRNAPRKHRQRRFSLPASGGRDKRGTEIPGRALSGLPASVERL